MGLLDDLMAPLKDLASVKDELVKDFTDVKDTLVDAKDQITKPLNDTSIDTPVQEPKDENKSNQSSS